MIRLVPMTDLEFDAFIELSMRDHAQGQVQAGSWPAADADAMIRKMRDHLLPYDLATPDHFFFAIVDAATGASVGGLWYTVEPEQRQLFVLDIQVYDEFRRRGYGTQAFRLMEEQARDTGLTTIALHVFRHNRPARAMYEKLGYGGQDEMMSKALGADAESS